MPRSTTPSFVFEVPVNTTAADEKELDTRLYCTAQIYNAVIGEGMKRLRSMRDDPDYKAAKAMPKHLGKDAEGNPIPNKARGEAFTALREKYGFTAYSLQSFAEKCRDDSKWIGEHLRSHDTQTISKRAFDALHQHAIGNKGKPRRKKVKDVRSIEGKNNDATIRYREEPKPAIHYSGLTLPIKFDTKDHRGYQAQAMMNRVKYVRLVKRFIRGRARWYAQLILEGLPPRIHPIGDGTASCDVGPSGIAVLSEKDAILEPFCPDVVEPWAQTRRMNRRQDRSRRAMNPDNYNPDGTIKKGKKKWRVSNRYKKRQRKQQNMQRCLAARRKCAHGRLQNRILAQGKHIKTEDVSYKGWQKSLFGRSMKVRGPGACMSGLLRKAESAGGSKTLIKTWTTKLSQFDHTTETYTKKPLSQRIHVFGDGKTEPVQRDLYSAFLASCCDETSLSIPRAKEAWGAAEPLLRRAMGRLLQPASGEGFPLAQVPRYRGLRVGRASKLVGPSVEGACSGIGCEKAECAEAQTIGSKQGNLGAEGPARKRRNRGSLQSCLQRNPGA